jgi:hypothetical protein
MSDVQAEANALIEQGNAAHSMGRLDDMARLYRSAIEREPAYASFNLVVADEMSAAGRLKEAVQAYRLVVEAVPEHDQAWEGLAQCLYRLGKTKDGDDAYRRFHEVEAGLTPGEIGRYTAAGTIDQRAAVICVLAHSLDAGVPQILHDFLVEAAADIAGPQAGQGNDFWAAIASVLVRFGLSSHLDRYSDGPTPSRDWLTDDLMTYLRKNKRPPKTKKHQPIFWTFPRHVARFAPLRARRPDIGGSNGRQGADARRHRRRDLHDQHHSRRDGVHGVPVDRWCGRRSTDHQPGHQVLPGVRRAQQDDAGLRAHPGRQPSLGNSRGPSGPKPWRGQVGIEPTTERIMSAVRCVASAAGSARLSGLRALRARDRGDRSRPMWPIPSPSVTKR